MADNIILKEMYDRLVAAIFNGPGLNCRPHSSRQRIDLGEFRKLHDLSPTDILRHLLGGEATARVTALVPRASCN